MKKEQIVIIGCGWLGLPLARHLSASGHNIITTVPTDKNIDELNKEFKTLLFNVEKDPIPSEINQSDIIIYTIPPLGVNEVERFFNQIKDLNKKIIFISSTAVYGRTQGEVHEETALDPKSPNALVLRIAESFLKTKFKNCTVIRPGGLYGEKRHPVYFLAGRTNITTGEEYLHLVHQTDCVSGIQNIIDKNLFGEDFNFVSDLRILKREYYTAMAKKLNLVAPVYEINPVENPTKISNQKSKKLLSINYLNPEDYS